MSFLVPAVAPSAPPQPSYLSSDDDKIELKLYRSADDGGLPITDYELWMDEGSVESDFSKVESYDFATHGFQYSVLKSENSMTTGLYYRFQYRSHNSYGYSAFSDSFMVGLGPLPAQPLIPTKAADESLSSSTSIKMEWSFLTEETLEVKSYSLYVDDGFGVTFSVAYKGDCNEFLVENLTPGIAYSFYVVATNFNGNSVRSDIQYLKSCISPAGVLAPTLVQTTSLTVELRWTYPDDNGCPI